MFLANENVEQILDEVLAPYIGVFFVAFVATFIATPILRNVAVRKDIIDHPDHDRKSHLVPVAYLGGLAIFIGWLFGILLCSFIAPHNALTTGIGGINFPGSVLLGALVIVITGLVDDIHGISPRVKIGGQFLAAAFLAMESVGIQLAEQTVIQLSGVQDPPFLLCYLLGAGYIAIFVVGGCNAVNLIDGMDGLATGVCSIAALAFLLIALHTAVRWGHPSGDMVGADPLADPVRIVMCLAILGALLGFLPYNFNPANIFMGDAGSLLLGYLCVTAILLFAHAAARGPVLVTAALIAFAFPILDTLMAIVRRLVAGHAIAEGDRMHVHHLIRARGYNVRTSVLIIYGICTAFATLAVLLVFLEVRWRYVLAILLVMCGFAIATAVKVGQRQAALREVVEPHGDSEPPDRDGGADGS